MNKFLQIFPELWPFANVGISNLSARFLEKYLSLGLETWSADRGWWVNYLNIFWKESVKYFRISGIYGHFKLVSKISKKLFELPAPAAQVVECPLRRTGGHGFDPGRDIPKSLKMVLVAPRLNSDLRGRARTGRPSVRIIILGVVSCQVSGAWYFSEAALEKWALSSLSQPDTVVIWLKNYWKRR